MKWGLILLEVLITHFRKKIIFTRLKLKIFTKMKKIILSAVLFLQIAIANAQAPTFEFLLSNTEGATNSKIYSVAKDATGNVFFCGTHTDALKFGSITLPSGKGGIFIGKSDSAGNIKWLKQAGTTMPNADIAYDIAIDKSNNVYVCGSLSNISTSTFDTKTLNNSPGFIAKYDNNGNLIWVKDQEMALYAIAIDGNDNIVVNLNDNALYKVDNSNGELYLDKSGLLNSNRQNVANHNIVIDKSNNILVQAGNKIIKFDPNFNQLWSTPISSSFFETFKLNIDAEGNAYGTFYTFFGSVSVGTTTVSNFPNSYFYKLKSTDGSPEFVDIITINGAASKIKEVIPDNAGHYYVMGDGAFNSTAIVKMNIDKSVIWTKSLEKLPVSDIDLVTDDCLIVGGVSVGNVTNDGIAVTNPNGVGENSFFGSICSGKLSIDDFNIDLITNIYPNPTQDIFTINVADTETHQATLYNIQGEKVLSNSFETTTTVNLKDYPKGVYILKLDNASKKIIKN